jgi:CubicO group peptidase (beta-lactamase class C family)
VKQNVLRTGIIVGALSIFAFSGSAAHAFSFWPTPAPAPAPAPTPPVVKPGDDAVLVAATKKALGSTYHVNTSTAFIDLRDGTTRYANIGPDAVSTRHYEIGSITKAFTGQLLADAIARGEVTADQKVGTLIPTLAAKPVGSVTLQQLATHTAGLPSIPSSSDMSQANMQFSMYGKDPYIFNNTQLYTHAINSYNANNRGKFIYSNMGSALLGHAVAAASRTTYKNLLQTRMLGALGMTNSIYPETAANLPAGSPLGKTSGKKTVSAWTMNAYAPAGGIRSDIADMASYAKQILQGTAPGMDALNGKYAINTSGSSQGFGWESHTNNIIAGRTLNAKNGMTGGFSSIILLDRTRGTAVVILSDTAVSVDSQAIALMKTDGK